VGNSLIYTDGIHLISSESLEELHAFARRIGLPQRWLHPTPRHPHYDLLAPWAKERAMKAGAVLKSSRELVQILRTCPYLQNVRDGAEIAPPRKREVQDFRTS
jgi:hypothetical protein